MPSSTEINRHNLIQITNQHTDVVKKIAGIIASSILVIEDDDYWYKIYSTVSSHILGGHKHAQSLQEALAAFHNVQDLPCLVFCDYDFPITQDMKETVGGGRLIAMLCKKLHITYATASASISKNYLMKNLGALGGHEKYAYTYEKRFDLVEEIVGIKVTKEGYIFLGDILLGNSSHTISQDELDTLITETLLEWYIEEYSDTRLLLLNAGKKSITLPDSRNLLMEGFGYKKNILIRNIEQKQGITISIENNEVQIIPTDDANGTLRNTYFTKLQDKYEDFTKIDSFYRDYFLAKEFGGVWNSIHQGKEISDIDDSRFILCYYCFLKDMEQDRIENQQKNYDLYVSRAYLYAQRGKESHKMREHFFYQNNTSLDEHDIYSIFESIRTQEIKKIEKRAENDLFLKTMITNYATQPKEFISRLQQGKKFHY